MYTLKCRRGSLYLCAMTALLWAACDDDENAASSDAASSTGGAYRDLSDRSDGHSDGVPTNEIEATAPGASTAGQDEVTSESRTDSPMPGAMMSPTNEDTDGESSDDQSAVTGGQEGRSATTGGTSDATPAAGGERTTIPNRGGEPSTRFPPRGGGLGVDFPPRGGGPNMGFPPRGGGPGLGFPPRGGRPGVGFPPRGGRPGAGFPPRGGRRGIDLEPDCRTDDDCPNEQVCAGRGILRRCEDTPECARDEDCRILLSGNLFACNERSGRCERRACMNDGECGRTGTCVDNRCQPRRLENPPMRPGGPCVQDQNCAPGEVCLNQMCVDEDAAPLGQAGDACQSDQDCDMGLICDRNSEVCQRGCRDDRQCPRRRICNLATNQCEDGPRR
ncbi:MAG: hypothetical protein VX589_04425 [Myxococcota bacterium]|nr:hypothetical protein [Myxococcota bacterium]